MAQSKVSYDEEADKSLEWLECSICFLDFDEPKLLPCLHTFCLKCLKKYCEEEIDEDLKPCPLCRREFSIPRGGVVKLPDNDFMVRMVSTKKLNEDKEKPIVCDPCAAIGENVEAQAYCKQCKQCLCKKCKKYHSVQAFAKSHKIVGLEERPSEESLFNMSASFCPVHNGKELELYCYDCNLLVCLACYFESHGTHNCKLMQEVARLKKEEFFNDESRAQECASEGCEQLKKIYQEREKTLLEAADAIQSIEDSCVHIIKLITSSKDILLNSIKTIKANRLKELEIVEDLVKLRGNEVDSFLSFGRMVMERGTDCEIIRVADELHKRAEELIKSQYKSNEQKLSDCTIKFTPSPAPTEEDVERLIGKVLDTDILEKLTTQGSIDANAHVDIQPSITSILKEGNIRDITIMSDKMFVLTNNDLSTVKVYDSYNGTAKPFINIPDMKEPLGIVSCSHNNALYIIDWESEYTYYVNLHDSNGMCWKLKENHKPFGLSMSLEHSLLVTIVQIKEDIGIGGIGESKVIEYTGKGQKIREIELHRSIDWAHHTIQLSEDQLVTCHGGFKSSLHRVCVINFEGEIIKSYGREAGRDGGQLSSPCSLAIDHNRSRVFVADSGNDRVLIFNKNLILLDQVQALDEVKSPWHVFFDSSSDRLFVTDRTGRVSIV